MVSFERKIEMSRIEITRLKGRAGRNKIGAMENFDKKLEDLFADHCEVSINEEEEPEEEPECKVKPKYIKIKKLDVTQNLDNTPEEPEFNFEIELQNIIDGGCLGKYFSNNHLESPNSIFIREQILNDFFNQEETYAPEVEGLLEIHLQFPSSCELETHRLSAWTNLKALLKALKENTGCRKLYNGIQFYRMAIVAKNGFKNYIERLPEIFKKIKGVIQFKAKEELQQIIILDEVLTTFEKRILRTGDYLKASHRDFEKAHLALALNIHSAREGWAPFSYEDFSRDLSEHELLFYPLKEVIIRRLGTKEFPRLIYLKKNEWSWYYLDSVSESGQRNWKLDAWLYNLFISLDEIMGKCTALYENLYNLRFQDREYRSLKDRSEGIEPDLQTLIKNIKIMSNHRRCYDYLRKHFTKELRYTLNKNDILDRRAPDPYVFRLYEEITEETMEKDWKNMCKRIYFNYDSFETF